MHFNSHFPDVPQFQDITTLGEDFYKVASQAKVLFSGAPCQNFSCARSASLPPHKSADLMLQQLKVVEKSKIPLCIFEQVPEFITFQGGTQFKQFVSQLQCMSYTVDHRVVNARQCGSSQNRSRLIIAATLDDSQCIRQPFVFPQVPNMPLNTTNPMSKHLLPVGTDWGTSIYADKFVSYTPSTVIPGYDGPQPTMQRLKDGVRAFDINKSACTLRAAHDAEFKGQTQAYVDTRSGSPIIRSLKVAEASSIQGFPDRVRWNQFNESTSLRLIGNSVDINMLNMLAPAITDCTGPSVDAQDKRVMSVMRPFVPPGVYQHHVNNLSKEMLDTLTKAQLKCSMRLAHCRLGHPGAEVMRRLGYSVPAKWFCTHCCAKMRHKNGSKTQRKPATKRGERFVMDICGKFPQMALFTNSQYLIGFKDTYTNKSFVYPMKLKTEVIDRFRTMLAEIKRDGVSITTLVTDSDTMFKDQKFRAECGKHGIHLELSAPEDHYQAGAAEILWRNIKTIAATMLVQSGLGQEYWCASLLHAAHTPDFLPSSANNNSLSPNDMWYTKKRTASHLRTFGVPCWVYDHKATGGQPKAEPATLYGYSTEQGRGSYAPDCYSVFVHRTKCLRGSRHVIFDESACVSSEKHSMALASAAQIQKWCDAFDSYQDPDH